MGALLLLAMMQVPDTMVVRVPLPAQDVRGDTTIVQVDVTHESVPVEILEGAQRSEAALARAIEACGCADTGPPGWFYAGLLSLGAAAIYVWHKKEPADINVTSSSESEGGDGGDGGHGPPWKKGKPHG